MPRGRLPNRVRIGEATRLREQGLKLQEIADQLGITRQGVQYLLTRSTVVTPPRCASCRGELHSYVVTARDRDILCLKCLAHRRSVAPGIRLKALRVAAGLTQKELGRRAGVAASTICIYESGKVQPQAAMLDLLLRTVSAANEPAPANGSA
jgi:DNA-binding XRE family transcriptional regulator